MSESNLYKQKIIDHYKNPRNKGKLVAPEYKASVNNSVCGDEVKVYIDVEEGKIKDVKHEATGCAICVAGMSMLSELLPGMQIEEVRQMKSEYMLELLGMQKRSPRIKCAVLGLDAVHRALDSGEDDPCDFC